jgi:hypothetical protein
VPDIRQDLAMRDTITAQAISHQASRLVLPVLQQPFEETLGCGGVPSVLNQDV